MVRTAASFPISKDLKAASRSGFAGRFSNTQLAVMQKGRLFAATSDEFTGRMFAAVNGMMLDVLAAVARKDYEDRRRRQAEGHAKAKVADVYKGRPEDAARNDGIARMLRTDVS